MNEDKLLTMEKEAANKPKPKKEVMSPYVGMWLVKECGNLPVAIFHPDFVDKAKELAEREWPGQHIFATIQVAERPLITRTSIPTIKAYAAQLLQKFLGRETPQTPEEVTSS